VTWWGQKESGTSWIRFSSTQSTDESHGAYTTWISWPRSCYTRHDIWHVSGWKYSWVPERLSIVSFQ
jgi:hypothetical protein